MTAESVAISHRLAAGWGRLVGSYGRAVVAGARVEQIFEAPIPEGPCVWVGWHGAVLITLALHLRLRQRPVTGFSPIGFSGAAMNAWLAVFKVDPVPITGTTFDGIMLRRLRRAVRAGNDIVIAADGPAGPRWIAKPGAIWLGAAAGVPVIPVGIAASPAIALPRWDRHLVPLPGAKVAIAVGAALPRDLDPRAPASTDLLQATIDRLTAEARAALGRRSRR
jgi:lysophospholipid acyltransferase (LPLAT)-like uncharacterized protein